MTPNILFISPHTAGTFDDQFFSLENELKGMVPLSVWRKSGNIKDILRKLPDRPDFILISNDAANRLTPAVSGLRSCGIPAGLIIHDVHRLVSERKHFILKNNIVALFSIPQKKFLSTYPAFKDRLIWMPHFFDPGVFRDYKIEKTTDLLLMGAANPEIYPLRTNIIKHYKDTNELRYHRHPGYQNMDGPGVLKGEAYAKEIARSKIFFTCPSVYDYPVKKYFEVLACNTLLLAPTFPELEELGFIPGVHFIAINEEDFAVKAAHYLKHEKERVRIAQNGHEMVHGRHTVKQRAHELVTAIEKILREKEG